MLPRTTSFLSCRLLAGLLLFSAASFAQFTGNIQGSVRDASAAAVSKASVLLVNPATQVTRNTTTDESGNYRFLSLAPGSYKVTVEASGFKKTETEVVLLTEQTLSVPISLTVGAATETMTVTAELPLVNTAETRNQLTLESSALSELPLAGRSFISLVTVAPGVSGLGTMGGGQPGGSGTPGSGVDNFSTETAVDVSANGQGTVANQFIIDGLNVTSGIRQGVLNLTPNPDAIQETSIQVNTFSSEYGGGSSIQMASTTKSGSDKFHGLASDYFNYQNMYGKTEFMSHTPKYNPFHSNNFSGAIGGPIIPHKQFFFFFAVEPLRSSASTGNVGITFQAPEFAAWALQHHPNTFGTKILNTYAPVRATVTGVGQTADTYFGHVNNDPSGPFICAANPAAIENIPCSLPMTDVGVFNSSNFRNGDQYFLRIDKYFKNDRIYGSFFRTILHFGGPAATPQFSTTNHNTEQAFQVNYTHTFSPTTLNEAIFAQNRIEGFLGETGDFTIPGITVSGSQGYGVGFAQGDFIQHNYHWRDVLTHVRGTHVLKFGYEGWFGDDVEPFQGPWSQPKFDFDNLLNLAQDAPRDENGVMYNPVTGQQQLWDWNAASRTWGFFAQDTWKARRNLTVTLGFRYDDQGNPYSRSKSTVFGNFNLGPGSTFQDRVGSGFAKATTNALHQSPKVLNPRVGIAWDVNGKGDWVVRGGFGVYANWLTQANVQEEFRGNPPGLILPSFFRGTSTPPVFVQGTSSKPPFGFTFPPLAGSPLCPVAPCLDSKGGIAGARFPIGGINADLKSPEAYIFAATLEHRIGDNLVASVLYSGSHSTNLVGNGNQAGIVSYGVDINAKPGDLLTNPAPTRLNTSFGSIAYTNNDRVANYNGVTLDLRGRSRRGFFDASYTHSSSKDDAGNYPTAINPHQFYGPSPWDVPNRFSLTLNYQVPGLNGGNGALGYLTGGWGISGTSIYQSGYPLTVVNFASFSGGGDYNADGDNLDYPNVSSYHQDNSRSSYFSTGSIAKSQFSAPTPGTNGNEKTGQFRQPNFAETDLTAYKDNRLTERLALQLRFEFFNVFNRPNLYLDNSLTNGSFGKAIRQQLPRNWQIGAKFTF